MESYTADSVEKIPCQPDKIQKCTNLYVNRKALLDAYLEIVEEVLSYFRRNNRYQHLLRLAEARGHGRTLGPHIEIYWSAMEAWEIIAERIKPFAQKLTQASKQEMELQKLSIFKTEGCEWVEMMAEGDPKELDRLLEEENVKLDAGKALLQQLKEQWDFLKESLKEYIVVGKQQVLECKRRQESLQVLLRLAEAMGHGRTLGPHLELYWSANEAHDTVAQCIKEFELKILLGAQQEAQWDKLLPFYSKSFGWVTTMLKEDPTELERQLEEAKMKVDAGNVYAQKVKEEWNSSKENLLKYIFVATKQARVLLQDE
ncbi:unnamed protein product [Orchesella dallaii]|uniref:Uncharacterized protein n=1 Tax=Orchesella dallaii TaxID=48710 RepID=A0ABP1QLY1_9HEXA